MWYSVSKAPRCERLSTLGGVPSERPRIEEVLREGKGEVGLAHHEVRSWVGWHHPMTLALLALWFLTRERRRVESRTPAVMPPRVRQIFSQLLRDPPPHPVQSAAHVNRVLRRNQQSRIEAWHQKPRTFPPRRLIPDGLAGAPSEKWLQ